MTEEADIYFSKWGDSGEVDLLVRNSTWTFSRDTDLKFDFVAGDDAEHGIADAGNEAADARDATQDEIKRAYRKLARKFHPDINKDPSAESQFKEVGEAYEALGDAEKRAAYDQLGKDWRPGEEFKPPPDGIKGSRASGPTPLT